MTFDSVMRYLSELNAVSIFLRLFLAVVFSGIIGFERGKKGRAAGFRTHMLVCLGATLAMLTNQYIFEFVGGDDPTRIAAQVVSGIGFLGAGTIIVTGRQQVKGLTTAAGLWASACMGLALGVGFYSGALIGFFFIVLVIILLHNVDSVLDRYASVVELYMELNSLSSLKSFAKFCRESGIKFTYQQVSKIKVGDEDAIGMLVTVNLGKTRRELSIAEIGLIDGISYVEELT